MQSRGPTATTPVLQPGNDGSTPSGTTTNAQVRQLAERLGLNPRDSGSTPALGTDNTAR